MYGLISEDDFAVLALKFFVFGQPPAFGSGDLIQ